MRRRMTLSGMADALALDTPGLPHVVRDMARHALVVLAGYLAGDFPQRHEVAGDVGYNLWNRATPTYLRLILFAAYLEVASVLPGFKRMCLDLSRHGEVSRWLHTVSVLELAWRMRAAGPDVSVTLEPKIPGTHRSSDLAITTQQYQRWIEVTSLQHARRMSAGQQVYDRIAIVAYRLAAVHQVQIQGRFDWPSSNTGDDVVPWVVQATENLARASRAAALGLEIPVREPAGLRVVVKRRRPQEPAVNIAAPRTQTQEGLRVRRSLSDKAKKYDGYGPVLLWLTDASWLFYLTPWAREALPQKLEQLATLLQPVFDISQDVTGLAVTNVGQLRWNEQPTIVEAAGGSWAAVYQVGISEWAESHVVARPPVGDPVLNLLRGALQQPWTPYLTRLLTEAGYPSALIAPFAQVVAKPGP